MRERDPFAAPATALPERLRVRPWLQASLAGAVSALAFPPIDALPAIFAYGWLLALLLDAPSWPRAWRLAVLFVFAQALVGLHWVAVAFTVDLERFGALAVPAVVLLALGIALIQGTVTSLIAVHRWRAPLAAALAFAPLWLAGEALRSLIGQFPWNLAGYALAGWLPLAQGAAIGSVWWLGAVVLVVGCLPLARRCPPLERRTAVVAVASGLLALVAWGQARLLPAEPVTETRLRLVQGAFALDHGFAPERLRPWFARQLQLSRQGSAAVDAVIWSEGATPYLLAEDPTARALIGDVLAALPGTAWLLTGGDTLVRDGRGEVVGVTNSLFALDAGGVIGARYDKVDLVPFGEFLPFRTILGALGLEKVTAGTLDYVAGPARQTITLPGLPPFSPLICYEAIFAGRVVAAPRPEWLLNVTIDTWFGPTIGPYQHLAMARMRAIEEGLPLVRVANSGISAVVTPTGRTVARTALGPIAVRDAVLPAPREPTLFARARWWPLGLTLALLVAGAAIREAASRQPRA